MTVEEIRLSIAAVVKLLGLAPNITVDHYNTLLERANLDLLDRAVQELGSSQEVTDILMPLKVKADLTFAAGVASLPTGYVRLLAIFDAATNVSIEVLEDSEIGDRLNNPITAPTVDYPVVYFVNDEINILPNSITTGVDIHYIKEPTTPVYATVDTSGGVNVYFSSTSVQLDWGDVYHIEIIKLILGYLGINPEMINKIKR